MIPILNTNASMRNAGVHTMSYPGFPPLVEPAYTDTQTNVQYMSIKSHHTVTVSTLVLLSV